MSTAAVVEVQCPHCKAVLKLKSRKPLGKTVPCPKCEETFVAKERKRPAGKPAGKSAQPARRPARQPAAKRPPAKKKPARKPVREAVVVDEYDEFDDFSVTQDDYDDYGGGDGGGFADDEDFAPRPRKKRHKKKSKSSGAWIKWVFIGGGAALGLALLGIGIWLIVGLIAGRKIDLAYLPPDANHISCTRYADIWNSEIVQDGIKSDTKKAIEKMKDDYGFEPKDVVSLTEGRKGSDSIKVARTSVDMDPEKILKNAGNYEKSEYGGETYYRIGRYALYFPDKRTAISGPEDSVKKAMDRGEKVESRDDLKFADTAYHVVTIHIKTSDELEQQEKFSGSFMGISIPKTIATCSGQSFTSSLKSKSQMRFASVEAAKKYEDEVRELQKKMQEKLKDFDTDEIYKHMSDKEKEEMREAMNSYSYDFSRSGDTITTTMSFTPTKRMREKGSSYMPGFGSGVSRIRTLAKYPNHLFGFVTSSPRSGPFGRSNRVVIYQVTLGTYSGQGNKDAAVRDAIRRVSGLDTGRVTFNGDTVLLYSQKGRTVSTSAIRNSLRRAGFRSPSARVKGTE